MENVIDFKRYREKHMRIQQKPDNKVKRAEADIILFTGVRIDYKKKSALKNGKSSRGGSL